MAIKEQKNITFRDCEADSLVLWNISIPSNLNLKESIDELCLVSYDATQKLEQIFLESPAEGHIHILIKSLSRSVEPLEMARTPIPEELAHAKAAQMAKVAPAPSSVSKISKGEQDEHPIYNGRPAGRRGPPVTIYHAAFAELRDTLRDPYSVQDKNENRVEDTAKLFLVATEIYETEEERCRAVIPHLKNVLGFTLAKSLKTKDGVICYIEFKNELGISGDGGVQAALALRKHLVKKDYKEIRNVSCPCIVLSLGGPYMYISISEMPFAQDQIIHLWQVFFVVAQALRKLKRFNQNLNLKSTPDIYQEGSSWSS
ncbi:hypothetical protein AX14_011836 [Amanita brunnescens Koide BX004]|nr:hypothetical protein AX14_011836 [Amanita brunnescens Koide BX004]